MKEFSDCNTSFYSVVNFKYGSLSNFDNFTIFTPLTILSINTSMSHKYSLPTKIDLKTNGIKSKYPNPPKFIKYMKILMH